MYYPQTMQPALTDPSNKETGKNHENKTQIQKLSGTPLSFLCTFACLSGIFWGPVIKQEMFLKHIEHWKFHHSCHRLPQLLQQNQIGFEENIHLNWFVMNYCVLLLFKQDCG